MLILGIQVVRCERGERGERGEGLLEADSERCCFALRSSSVSCLGSLGDSYPPSAPDVKASTVIKLCIWNHSSPQFSTATQIIQPLQNTTVFLRCRFLQLPTVLNI